MRTVSESYNNKVVEKLHSTAWVKAGTAVTATSAADAAKQAGLDWTVSLHEMQAVQKVAVSIDDTFNYRLPVTTRVAVVKTMPDCDLGDSVIGVVGSKYKVVQNMEVFNALDTLIDSGDARYAAAGEINGGGTVWMVLELPKEVSVAGDPHAAHLLVRTSHDGSSSVIIKPIIQRIFCANQINGIIRGKKHNKYTYKMHHTTNSELSIADIRNITQLTYDMIDEYELAASVLQRREMRKDEVTNFFKRVWALPPEVEDAPLAMLSQGQQRQQTIAVNARAKAWEIYNTSPTQENIRGNAFGAWQAVVEYADHYAIGGADKRAVATLVGRNDTIKAKAFSLLTV